jgi:hypothetical protein
MALRRPIGHIAVLISAVMAAACGATGAAQSHATEPSAAQASDLATAKSQAHALARTCDEAVLTSCLITKPAGTSFADGGWGLTVTPSAQYYATQYFGSSEQAESVEVANLQAYGLRGIAHLDVAKPDGDQADIVVMRFASPAGALALGLSDQGTWLGPRFADGKTTAIPGVPGVAYTDPSRTHDGRLQTQYVATVGDLFLGVRFNSVGPLDQADLDAWTQAEYQTLTTAAPPAASDSVPIPANIVGRQGAAACTIALECLIPLPAGAYTLPDNTYADDPSPTLAEYAAAYFNTTNQPYETQALITAGATGLVHRDFIAADGDQTDITVLTFANPVDAQADTLGYQGSVVSQGRDFAIPGLPGALGVLESADADGQIYTALTGYVGDHEVRMSYWSPRVFSPADALTWFDQQMAEL